jgi:hypothetical protein
MMFTTVIIGTLDFKFAKFLIWYAMLAGSVIFIIVFYGSQNEELQSIYCLMYSIFFTYFIFRQLLQPTMIKNVIPISNADNNLIR